MSSSGCTATAGPGSLKPQQAKRIANQAITAITLTFTGSLSRRADTRQVRHDETFCTGAQRNRPERTEAAAQKTKGNEAYRRGPESVNRSLDHVIGVRIPASQPFFVRFRPPSFFVAYCRLWTALGLEQRSRQAADPGLPSNIGRHIFSERTTPAQTR